MAAAAPARVDPGTFVADALGKAGVLDFDTASEFGRLFSRFIRQTKKPALDWCVAALLVLWATAIGAVGRSPATL
jgi:hypothetical protein